MDQVSRVSSESTTKSGRCIDPASGLASTSGLSGSYAGGGGGGVGCGGGGAGGGTGEGVTGDGVTGGGGGFSAMLFGAGFVLVQAIRTNPIKNTGKYLPMAIPTWLMRVNIPCFSIHHET